MKKSLFCIFFLFTASFLLFSAPANNVKEIRLENGLTVFTLEDYSTPLIKIEFVTKAGISSQTARNAGFFTLYSRILSNNLQSAIQTEVECNSDCTRFSLTTTPSELNSVFQHISRTVFSPDFTDEILQKELSDLKNEVLENEKSVGGFINASIDSRVFSDAPWKHDSGIYPALFSTIDFNQARITLYEISEKYYTPQNSAIFISGNIQTEQIKKLLEVTFGIYYSSSGLPSEKPVNNENIQKKYVIHHSEITDELTQIVLQYTAFTPDQSDLAATFLNTDYSNLKTSLLQENSLLIPGAEYIDVAAARKKNNSRLIIQALLQADKKTSVFQQSETFINTTLDSLKNISQNELNYGKYAISENSSLLSENSQAFMNYLASYWSVKEYDNISADNPLFSIYDNSVTCAAMMNRPEKLQTISLEELDSIFEQETPFVFVIMNSKTFNKNKNNFINNGFEEISVSNGSWYSQELYKRITQEALNTFNSQTQQKSNNNDNANSFYSKNINTVKTSYLNNNIPVYVKENKNSTSTTILLHIEGGKNNSINNNGFEELLTELLSSNIQNQIYIKRTQNLIHGQIDVSSQTNLTNSQIIIECTQNDFEECIHSINEAILNPVNMPAVADRIVSNLQYKKRLSNGDAEYQMFAQITKLLYGKKDLYNIFEAENDILQNITYDHIMEMYSFIADSNRLAFVLTGAIPDNYLQIISQDFDIFLPGVFSPDKIPDFTLPSKNQMIIKFKHTFLTDTPASKAGKMPAVLIPTTEFVDPAIYLFNMPSDKNDFYLCSAIFVYLQNTLPQKINERKLIYPASNKNNSNFTPKNCEIFLRYGNNNQNFTTMTFRNVARPYEITKVYKEEINNLENNFSSIQNTSKITQNIKNMWMEDYFWQCSTNTGMAQMIQKNIDFLQENRNPEEYLTAYKIIDEATPEDFIRIIETYFKSPSLKIYSSDSKK